MATTPEYAGYHPESSGVNFFYEQVARNNCKPENRNQL